MQYNYNVLEKEEHKSPKQDQDYLNEIQKPIESWSDELQWYDIDYFEILNIKKIKMCS